MALFALLAILLVLLLCSAYSAQRWGFGFLALLAPLFCIEIFAGGAWAAALLCAIFIGGLAGLAADKKLPFAIYTACAPLFAAAVISGDYYYGKAKTGIDPFERSTEQTLQIVETADIPQEQKKLLTSQLKVIAETVKGVIPFCAFVYSLLFSAVGFLAVKRFFLYLKKEVQQGALAAFELNGYVVFALIAAWAGVLFLMKTGGIVYYGFLNAALMISALYFVQAIGVLSFFLKSKNISGWMVGIPFCLLLIAGGGISVLLIIMLTGVGVLDLWADFRKLHTKETGGLS